MLPFGLEASKWSDQDCFGTQKSPRNMEKNLTFEPVANAAIYRQFSVWHGHATGRTAVRSGVVG